MGRFCGGGGGGREVGRGGGEEGMRWLYYTSHVFVPLPKDVGGAC